MTYGDYRSVISKFSIICPPTRHVLGLLQEGIEARHLIFLSDLIFGGQVFLIQVSWDHWACTSIVVIFLWQRSSLWTHTHWIHLACASVMTN